VQEVGVFLRNGHYFQLQQAVGISTHELVRFHEGSSTIRNLMRSNQPATLYREDPDGWYLLADEQECETLEMIRAELLLPLTGRDRLLGVMTLGAKRSQAAYSSSDLRLLQSVGAQAGLALEISELAHSLARQATERERIEREIEIAREVQERLYPQEIPVIDGLSLAGACRPAQGVGGDYYDLIELDDGRIGLAIGDVSGKGISAALLMASLRASLRGMTMDGPNDLAKLMHKVNRLVYEASANNRYATFFFATYEPRTRALRYVNAGHNPPVVVRGSSTLRLDGGGPVVGLLTYATYEEQYMALAPGDLLVAYTDGISEAMTQAQEEWGEERMIAAATSAPGSDAASVLKCIFAAADSFAAGAPQADDMTLLMMKLHPA
jgi:sigma-B regulation protein RsbU (phosphoserine phosphatase)